MTDNTGEGEATVAEARERLSPAFADQYEQALALDFSDGKVLDQERVALLLAAREELTQLAVIEWAEACGIGTRSSLTARKLRLEDEGLLDSQRVKQSNGRDGVPNTLVLIETAEEILATKGFEELVRRAAVGSGD
jgi:hypothetical protein